METVAVARHAMATRFEIVLHGEDPARLRGAGEEALAEVERIENQLSLYRPSSEIARVNSQAATHPVRVSPRVFHLLKHCCQLNRESGGAFDIAIAPLIRCWGFMDGYGSAPADEELERARACSGMSHVRLDDVNNTVRFDMDGVMLDLGAVGKGYAIDCAVEILREAGVTRALVHGGTSTVYGLGRPPEGEWKIQVESPPDYDGCPWMATVSLHDEALSVSAGCGKSFRHQGKTLGHVIDPGTGQPGSSAALAAVVLPSAAETDALSTALLVKGRAGHDDVRRLRPKMRTLVAEAGIAAQGIEWNPLEIIGKAPKTS